MKLEHTILVARNSYLFCMEENLTVDKMKEIYLIPSFNVLINNLAPQIYNLKLEKDHIFTAEVIIFGQKKPENICE